MLSAHRASRNSGKLGWPLTNSSCMKFMSVTSSLTVASLLSSSSVAVNSAAVSRPLSASGAVLRCHCVRAASNWLCGQRPTQTTQLIHREKVEYMDVAKRGTQSCPRPRRFQGHASHRHAAQPPASTCSQ